MEKLKKQLHPTNTALRPKNTPLLTHLTHLLFFRFYSFTHILETGLPGLKESLWKTSHYTPKHPFTPPKLSFSPPNSPFRPIKPLRGLGRATSWQAWAGMARFRNTLSIPAHIHKARVIIRS